MNIDFNQIGLRLGIVVAGFTGGETEAAEVGGVSKCTLTRYLKGTKPQAQAAVLAKICAPHGINLNWLMYGPPHPQVIQFLTEYNIAEAEYFDKDTALRAKRFILSNADSYPPDKTRN